jgi:hypothetical protein
MGSGGITPRILSLGTRWMLVVSFAPRTLYGRGKEPRGGPHSRSPCREPKPGHPTCSSIPTKSRMIQTSQFLTRFLLLPTVQILLTTNAKWEYHTSELTVTLMGGEGSLIGKTSFHNYFLQRSFFFRMARRGHALRHRRATRGHWVPREPPEIQRTKNQTH